jgi:hypothetical protein
VVFFLWHHRSHHWALGLNEANLHAFIKPNGIPVALSTPEEDNDARGS